MSELKRGLTAGLLASLLMTGAMALARFSLGTPLIPELMAERLFSSVTPAAFTFFVRLFGMATKYLAFGALVCSYLVAGALLGLAYRRVTTKWHAGPPWLAPAAFGLFLWAVTMGGLMPALGLGPFGASLRGGAVRDAMALLLLYWLYSFSLNWMGRKGAMAVGPASRGEGPSQHRRLFLRRASLGLILLGLWGKVSTLGTALARNLFPEIKGHSPEVTSNKDFYTVSKNVFNPKVDGKKWKLSVKGLVEKPFSLTLEELKGLPSVQQYATLICISNEVGGNLISNALWKGVPLRELLSRAGPKKGANELILRADDDYSDSFPLAKGMEGGTILAYEMNGEPLPPTHGYPARLIVPGIYGMKNVKWLTEIELADYDYKGYWEKRGWSDEAIIKTMSRIDLPGGGAAILKGKNNQIAGIAFAGDRGITKIEVSTDGGVTWAEALTKKPLSPYTWVLWAYEWKPSMVMKGDQTIKIMVRATDGKGQPQIQEKQDPLPSGSSGLHVVPVVLEG